MRERWPGVDGVPPVSRVGAVGPGDSRRACELLRDLRIERGEVRPRVRIRRVDLRALYAPPAAEGASWPRLPGGGVAVEVGGRRLIGKVP
jgi:hypothetical protein